MATIPSWTCSEHLFPDPLDSRKRVMNPDYHPPIEYVRGKFRNMVTGEEIPKKDVPAYILEAVKNIPKEVKQPDHVEYDMKDIMAGKPLLNEALTAKVRAEAAKKAKPKRKRNAKAKRKRVRRVGNARAKAWKPEVQLGADSDGREAGNSDWPERATKGSRRAKQAKEVTDGELRDSQRSAGGGPETSGGTAEHDERLLDGQPDVSE